MVKQVSYCGEMVRDYDPDRFLLSMFAPPCARDDLWALFAFNLEIAKTREVVTETQLGLIRLQWWREEIAKIYDGAGAPDHEGLRALARAIQTHALPQKDFETLIYGREFDLEDVLPSDLEGMLNYADYTATPLMRLAVRICGDNPDMEPVRPVAVNYALTGLLRAVPSHARQRRCYMPQALLDMHEVKLEDIYAGKSSAGLKDAVSAVAVEFVDECRPGPRLLKATQALAALYKQQIMAAQYDVFHPKMQAPPAFKALRVLLKTYLP